MSCSGDGGCLKQMDDYNYQKGYGDDCPHHCEPLQCPNYIICKQKFPLWLVDCHGGFCMHCTVIFGCQVEIITKEKEECAICFEETDKMAKFPQCSHYVCISCYKRIYFGKNHGQENVEEDEENIIINSCPMCRREIEHEKWWKTYEDSA